MLKIILILKLMFFVTFTSYAQELLLRSNDFSVEAYIKVDPSLVKSIQKGSNTVVIIFHQKIKEPFVQNLDNRFIDSVVARDDQFTFYISKDADFSVINDDAGLKIVATKKVSDTDILMSYGVGKPLLTESTSIVEDRGLEDELSDADLYVSEKRYARAANILNDVLKKSKNEFYRQEALYKLGKVYMLLGESNQDYYIDAYETFDNFIKLYPDNVRVADALFQSAAAKENIGQLYEAIFTYDKVYNSLPDVESQKIAMMKMAELYVRLSQFDKAIDVYNNHAEQYIDNREFVYSELGKLHHSMGDLDSAYEAYINLNVEMFMNNPSNGSEELYRMADTFEKKKKYADALNLYERIYTQYPESAQTINSIKSISKILTSLDREEEADQLLLKMGELYLDQEIGQKALLEYANKYFTSKDYNYWNDFFKPVLEADDLGVFHMEVRYLLLKALYNEKKYSEALIAANNFIANYDFSTNIQEVMDIREEIMIMNLTDTFINKDYENLDGMVNNFSALYPNTKYQDRVDEMVDELYYRDIIALYTDNKFDETIAVVEKLIQEDNISEAKLDRLLKLLDDSYYKKLSLNIAMENFDSSVSLAKQYKSIFPEGKSYGKVETLLVDTIVNQIKNAYSNGEYEYVVDLYNDSRDLVDTIKDKAELNELLIDVARSAYNIGVIGVAQNMYDEITPIATENYVMLGLLLNQNPNNFNINLLNAVNLEYITSLIEPIQFDKADQILNLYTSNIGEATRIKYKLSKNILDDDKREAVLLAIYDVLKANSSAKFEGSNDILLDVGLINYRKNNFTAAVEPLNSYILAREENDEKKAEALYYLGKSFINMNDKDRGYRYYRTLVDEIPDSIYAGIAKGEMEEDDWKDKLN